MIRVCQVINKFQWRYNCMPHLVNWTIPAYCVKWTVVQYRSKRCALLDNVFQLKNWCSAKGFVQLKNWCSAKGFVHCYIGFGIQEMNWIKCIILNTILSQWVDTVSQPKAVKTFFNVLECNKSRFIQINWVINNIPQNEQIIHYIFCLGNTCLKLSRIFTKAWQDAIFYHFFKNNSENHNNFVTPQNHSAETW